MKRWLLALIVIPAIVAVALLNPSEDDIIGGATGSDELCCVFDDDLTGE